MAGSTITKDIEFDAGHRVPNHASKCRNPHGHRYRVVMHVSGDLVAVPGDSQEGMVLDFGFMKQLLTERVHDVYDHGSIAYQEDGQYLISLGEAAEDEFMPGRFDLVNHELGEVNRFGWKVAVVGFVPTAENLAKAIFEDLQQPVREMTDNRAWLTMIEVWETPTSCALWGVQPR